MRFLTTLAVVLNSLAAAKARGSFIGASANGTHVKIGSTLTVQNSIQGSREVGLAIGLLSCPDTPCTPPGLRIGTVLFTGQFAPVLHEIPGKPYQNFSVTLSPDVFIQKGTAELNVDRFHLIGAGPAPILEFNGVTVIVE
ncbi:hypothetical protein BD779DRAFT_1473190 [Infundibulicybe gibba]|nr:hypothetical protein BD779DRAFT_1473190 [Infundibulicybe gibba]